MERMSKKRDRAKDKDVEKSGSFFSFGILDLTCRKFSIEGSSVSSELWVTLLIVSTVTTDSSNRYGPINRRFTF